MSEKKIATYCGRDITAQVNLQDLSDKLDALIAAVHALPALIATALQDHQGPERRDRPIDAPNTLGELERAGITLGELERSGVTLGALSGSNEGSES